MQGDNIEQALTLAHEGTREWDDAMSRGRTLVDAATQETTPAHAAAKLREAARHFQMAIGINSAKDEGYGWLARALRLLAQAIRGKDPDAATHCLRSACAVVWEARTKTPASALSVFTKQELKALVAWLRMVRRLDPQGAEGEMETLRAEFLTSALDPDTMAAATGG
ncbi:MAG: hypothetical protein AABZ94_00640 [Candidatus Eisenbacteria bacterium]